MSGCVLTTTVPGECERWVAMADVDEARNGTRGRSGTYVTARAVEYYEWMARTCGTGSKEAADIAYSAGKLSDVKFWQTVAEAVCGVCTRAESPRTIGRPVTLYETNGRLRGLGISAILAFGIALGYVYGYIGFAPMRRVDETTGDVILDYDVRKPRRRNVGLLLWPGVPRVACRGMWCRCARACLPNMTLRPPDLRSPVQPRLRVPSSIPEEDVEEITKKATITWHVVRRVCAN